MLYDHLAQQNCFVPLQKFDADIPISKWSISPSIKQTQFPFTFSITIFCHGHVPYMKCKVHTLSIEAKNIWARADVHSIK